MIELEFKCPECGHEWVERYNDAAAYCQDLMAHIRDGEDIAEVFSECPECGMETVERVQLDQILEEAPEGAREAVMVDWLKSLVERVETVQEELRKGIEENKLPFPIEMMRELEELVSKLVD